MKGKDGAFGQKRSDVTEDELRNKTEEERDEYFREQRRKRKLRRQKQERRRKLMILGATAAVSLVVVVGAVRGITEFVGSRISSSDKTETMAKADGEKEAGQKSEDAASAQQDILDQANLLAAQYDYDSAIQLLKSSSGYEKNTEFQNAVKGFYPDQGHIQGI